MKTLILHTGLHKTGSTAIQEALARNQTQLQQHGYLYPVFTNLDGVPENNHSYMFQLAFKKQCAGLPIIKKKGWDPTKAAACYLAQLKEAKRVSSNLILSGEGIYALSSDELNALQRMFKGWHIQVICYVRPAYSFFCSALQERVKNGNADSVVNYNGRAESQTIALFKTVFQDIRFLSFPDACNHQDGPAGDFFTRLNLPYIADNSDKPSNVGLGNVVTRLCTHLNSQFPRKIKGRGGFQPVFRSTALAIEESRFLLHDCELANIKQKLVTENEALHRLTGLDFRGEIMKVSASAKLSAKQSFRLVWKLAKQSPEVYKTGVNYLKDNQLMSNWIVLLSPLIFRWGKTQHYIFARVKLLYRRQ